MTEDVQDYGIEMRALFDVSLTGYMVDIGLEMQRIFDETSAIPFNESSVKVVDRDFTGCLIALYARHNSDYQPTPEALYKVVKNLSWD